MHDDLGGLRPAICLRVQRRHVRAGHLHGSALPPAARDMLGDALWACMIMGLVSAVAPAVQPGWRAAAALAISFAVELGQLYHAPAIDAIRTTTAGHLILGSDFDLRDFAAYSAGVVAAALLELAVTRTGSRTT